MKLRYPALAAAATLCLVYALTPRQDAPLTMSTATPAQPQPQAAPALWRPTAAPPTAPAPVTAAPALTLSQRVDAFVKRGDPVSLFEAYKLVRDCHVSREYAARVVEEPAAAKGLGWRPEAETCGDITPGQIATRMQWVNAAADVGVHGAVEAVGLEGPEGDRRNYDNDNPAIMDAFNTRAVAQIRAGVQTGDPASIATAFSWYDGGISEEQPRNPVKALTYAVAWQAVTTGRIQYFAKESVNRLKREVPPEKVDEAVAAGNALVAAIQPAPLVAPIPPVALGRTE